MKVLIITYYWPPAGGSGVQRWLKFVKYLQEFGIEPIVYTVQDPNYPILDASLQEEIPTSVKVLKQPIREPNNILSFFKKNKSKQSAGFLNPNPSMLGRLMQYVRANYFIPDARKYWIKPSVNYLLEYLKQHPVDCIISSGPPHSLHLIGLEIKNKLNVKWISDFRDPWTDIDYFDQLPLTEKAKLKHHQLEQKVLKESDAVLVVGKTMKENYKPFSDNISILTNGYDSTIIESKPVELDALFSITHIGLMNADRNPFVFWKAIKELCKENVDFSKDLEIKLIGKIAKEVTVELEKLQKVKITLIDYVSHKKVKEYQEQSQVLLLAVNNVASAKGIITGKIFEYLQAKRPILAIGPKDGDLAEIINQTNAGSIVDFKDVELLKTELLKMYQSFKLKKLEVASNDIEQYHRKNLTKKLSMIIKDTVLN